MKYLFFLILCILISACQPQLEPAREMIMDQEITNSIDDETVCLAQALFSESQFTHEQVAVAWSIRNRVESSRYPDTYCGVVFQKQQFSGMNSNDPNYEINRDIPILAKEWIHISLNDYRGRAAHRYEDAQVIAGNVILADKVMDTCPGATHFWSPIAYEKGVIDWPRWARGVVADCVIRAEGSKTLRFAFYSSVP